jgi:tetratricopeptide (TPR) repeat protein
LGTLYMMQQRTDDALGVWKQLEAAAPTNVMAPMRAGAILLSLKRYPEALAETQAAVGRIPGNAELLSQLGVAYAETGAPDQAYATFQSALKIDPSSNNLNSIAYEMAKANLKLPEALQYAQKAVSEEESETVDIDINTATPQDFASATRLAAYWDTLGWVYFRSGNFDAAEKYLNAGWHLSQDPTIADHLGQLYEKEGKKREAVHAYSEAIATGHAPKHARERVNALADFAGPGWVQPSDLQNYRISKVALVPKPKDHANADFVVLLSPGGKVIAHYVSGSEELLQAGKALEAAKLNTPFPDGGPVQILRRGILDCEPELKECTFAMYPLVYPQQIIAAGVEPHGSGDNPDSRLSGGNPDSIVLKRRSGDSSETKQPRSNGKAGQKNSQSTDHQPEP